MHSSSWEPSSADHHAPLYKREWETPVSNNNVNYSVNYWITKGFPAAKINMGIPTYGQVDTSTNHLFTSFQAI
jgi:chitinase